LNELARRKGIYPVESMGRVGARCVRLRRRAGWAPDKHYAARRADVG